MSPESEFILVTGATGFLGSHVVQQLLEDGYRVRCTARPLKSRFLETAHLRSVGKGQLEVVEINDLASESLERVLEGITAVIHTAFPAPGSMDDTELLLNATSSTTSLLHQAYKHGIRKFVLTSSYLAMVGGGARGGANPGDGEGEAGEGTNSNGVWSDYVFNDQDWTHATYESVFAGTSDPATAYAAAKTLAEAAAWDFASARPDFDLATVLPTLLLGPFSPGHPILSTSDLSTNVLLHSLLTSGVPPHPVWPHFVDVRDAARAHVKALELPSLGGYSSLASPSTTSSNQSSSEQRTGTGQEQASDQPGSAYLSPSTNPSLVDLGTTLQGLEMSYQCSVEPSSSLLPTTPQSTDASTCAHVYAQNTAATLSSDAAESSSLTPTMSMFPTVQTRAPPRKRFIATGASFTWPDAISHLRTACPDLSASLPDERTCLPLPERVASVEGEWSGAAWASAVGLHADGGGTHSHSHVEDQGGGGSDGAGGATLEEGHGPVWSGLGIGWRDWRETVEDAVRDLKRVAGGLERSGWEDLFGEYEDYEENESQQGKEDDQEKGTC